MRNNNTNEQCNSCMKQYSQECIDRMELLETLVDLVFEYCSTCKLKLSSCNKDCTQIRKIRKIINKNKKFFKELCEGNTNAKQS